MATEIVGTQNLLEITNPRNIAQMALGYLETPDNDRPPSVVEIYRSRPDFLQVTKKAPEVRDGAVEWWNSFRNKYYPQGGDFERRSSLELLAQEYGQTVTQMILQKNGQITFDDVNRIWVIPESYGYASDTGLAIKTSQKNHMLQVVLECLIAYKLNFPGQTNTQEYENAIHYATLIINQCQHAKSIKDDYRKIIPKVTIPTSEVAQPRPLRERVAGFLGDPLHNIALIRGVQEAKAIFKQYGIGLPPDTPYGYYFGESTLGLPECRAVWFALQDPGGVRIIKWDKNNPYPISVTRRKEATLGLLQEAVYSVTIAGNPERPNSGIIQVS